MSYYCLAGAGSTDLPSELGASNRVVSELVSSWGVPSNVKLTPMLAPFKDVLSLKCLQLFEVARQVEMGILGTLFCHHGLASFSVAACTRPIMGSLSTTK